MAVIAVIMLLTTITLSLAPVAASGFVYRKNDSIYSDYKQFLNSQVVQKLPDFVKDDDVVSIIVDTGTPSLMDAYNATDKTMSFGEYVLTDAALTIKNASEIEKTEYLEILNEEGVKYTVGSNYSNVLAGFELLIEAKYYGDVIDCLPKGFSSIVGEVYEPAETELVENKVSIYEDTGIFDSSKFGYDGSGMVIAVLDTGLDYTHPAFSISNFHPSVALGLTKGEVAGHIGNTSAAIRVPGLTADDVYINDKVPFSFDYADNDSDVYSLHNNHGTHVSGVIVGKDDVITGVAPNAQLVSMKIFSDTLESARTSWILSALEDCVELGVDVINMSLGTACGFSTEIDNAKMAYIFDKIREDGISLVVAASNSFSSTYGSQKNGNLGLTSNPDTGTVGSPSTYPAAISIASINGKKTPYILDKDGKIIYFVESSDSAGEEKSFFDDLLGEGSTDTLKLDFVLVPGVGNPTDYEGIDVAGKIALVRRGSNTFEEKAKAAAEKGAKALIVYNNTSGDIRMNVGIVDIPVCSISQDDGEKLAKLKSGTLTVSHSQAAGPFMSDFSSWGPTPSLEIKPEITAHGGNILSAVTGHGYDRLSGTSMACPNMAGAIALMRQYVINEFPKDKITDENGNIDYVEVNAVINRLLMSTADTVYNKNGLPYAVRKQGSGLANLLEAKSTNAYILTYKNGDVMDKTKVELGHDPNKTGVYTFKFTIDNFGSTTLSYDVSASVMTEGVSDTPTYKGDTVVTEEGYLLSGAKFEIVSVSGGSQNGNNVTVGAGQKCDVQVKITLSEEDKKYLNDSFENGMYVEGFVTLKSTVEGETDLSLPYLAFYGNWYQAPLFDLDYFETNADELNDAIETLDKTLPDAYATRPVGGIEDDYISYLGSYYFLQNPQNKIISAKREYIAISNTEGTVHSLRFVWGGQLRNAKEILITITDDATGEVIFEKKEVSVRKSYGDGGSYIYPTNIEIEFDAAEHNLKNNANYTVKLVGLLEYGDGGVKENLNNTFEFPLRIDFEAPTLTGCEFYTEYDRTAKKTRLFAKMAVYDNHYSMAMQVGYVGSGVVDGETTSILYPFDQYITPIYSEENGTTYVTYELTDHIFDIKNGSTNKNTFAVTFYDYAMNDATYEIALPDDFAKLYVKDTEITLNTYETYTLSANVYPEGEWDKLLNYVSTNQNVVRVVNDKLIALPVTDEQIKKGQNVSTIMISSPTDPDLVVTMKVTVVNNKRVTKPVADVFEITGYDTLYAFYIMSNDERDIGETGDRNLFRNNNYSLSLYPNEKVLLNYKLDAFFPSETSVQFISGNENIVTVDQSGNVTAVGEGYTSITVRVLQDGKATLSSKSISIEVKDPYVRTGPTLNNYYGAGTFNSGKVVIPSDMLFTQIGQFAFSNYNYVPKDLAAGDIISEEEPDATKIAYIGNNFIREVVIPEGVETIGPYAFAGLTELTKVVLPKSLEAIEYGAFFGCSKLVTVEGLENVKLINKYAFQNCNIKNDLQLKNIHAVGDYAFAGNKNLTSVSFSSTLSSIGESAFAGNTSLENFDVSMCGNIKYGPFVFSDCTSLEEITINSSVIPTGAFYKCSALTTLNIGKDVSFIGEYALSGTYISEFSVAEGNTVYMPSTGRDYLLSADGTTLLMVAPGVSGTFELPGVTKIGYGAFAGNERITSVNMPDVTYIDSYAFSECRKLTDFTFGELTYIGDYAFLLTDITELPSFASPALTEIGDYAFAFTLIEEVVIKDGMTIGDYAFTDCSNIKTIKIGNNVKIGAGAFMRALNRMDPRVTTEQIPLNYKVSKITITEGSKTFEFYYFEYISALETLEIGENAIIGESAFAGAAKVQTITLGNGARIGDTAFYNCSSLVNIDLSGALSIGRMAFSGDNQYIYADSNCTSPAVNGDMYRIHFYAAPLVNIDLSSLVADGLGDQAFAYSRSLESVVLGTGLKTIPYMAFVGCNKLTSINLENVTKIGESAFSETMLTSVDLSSAAEIGKYAFSAAGELTSVIFNASGVEIEEGAFLDCAKLQNTTNFEAITSIGDYAFAYTDLRAADLTNAVYVGDYAFIKDTLTTYTFDLTLGKNIEALGDNPFAMCKLAPLYTTVSIIYNGDVVGSRVVYTFDIDDSDDSTCNVKIIDGSIYCVVPYGLELVTYVGLDENGKSLDSKNVMVADGTVKISGMAFAGSSIKKATLPDSLNAIGHKAFYECDKLSTIIFKSYEAPALLEEFDESYYTSFENLPCSGTYEFIMYKDLDGDGVLENGESYVQGFEGLGIVPYYMWNISSNKYNNIYYGANFVDYIGHTLDSNRRFDNAGDLFMVAPSNGVGYDSFIYSQYFSESTGGEAAADSTTKAAMDAINKIPTKLSIEDEAIIIAARQAYNKVSNQLQLALLTTHYDRLRTAEKFIEDYKNAMKPTEPPKDEPDAEPTGPNVGVIVAIIISSVVALGAAGFAIWYFILRKKFPRAPKGDGDALATDGEGAEETPREESATEVEEVKPETETPATEDVVVEAETAPTEVANLPETTVTTEEVAPVAEAEAPTLAKPKRTRKPRAPKASEDAAQDAETPAKPKRTRKPKKEEGVNEANE